jgi:hypothetical protein
MFLVGFTIEIYYNAQSNKRQTLLQFSQRQGFHSEAW